MIILFYFIFLVSYEVESIDFNKIKELKFNDKFWTEENVNKIILMRECFNSEHMGIIDNLFLHFKDTKQSKILEAKGLYYFYYHLTTGINFCSNFYDTVEHIIKSLKDFIKINEHVIDNFKEVDEQMGYTKTLKFMELSLPSTLSECNRYNTFGNIIPPSNNDNKNQTKNKYYPRHHYITGGTKGQSVVINCLQRHRKKGMVELVKTI